MSEHMKSIEYRIRDTVLYTVRTVQQQSEHTQAMCITAAAAAHKTNEKYIYERVC